jgi:hypothetical protein
MTFDADSACRALQRSFEQNHEFGHMHPYDLFRIWLEAVWAFLNATHDPDHFKQTLDQYTAAQGAEIGRLMFLYVEAVERNPFEDVLGELFMRLDLHAVRAGQFFTPGPVAEMMARMQFSREDFEAKVAEKGCVTVCDPAVGSGVMLLAFAKVVVGELGRPALRHVHFYGMDIDPRCVAMTRIQLRMNGCDQFSRLAYQLATLDQLATAVDTPPSPPGEQPGPPSGAPETARPAAGQVSAMDTTVAANAGLTSTESQPPATPAGVRPRQLELF